MPEMPIPFPESVYHFFSLFLFLSSFTLFLFSFVDDSILLFCCNNNMCCIILKKKTN